MHAPRLALAAPLLSLLAACQSTVAATSAPSPEGAVLADFLPPAKHALQIEAGEGAETTLADLIDQLAGATGMQFAIDPVTYSELQKASAGLRSPVNVPAEEAWRWVEGLLAHNRYQLGVISNRPPQLLGVFAPLQRPNQPMAKPIQLAEADLGQCTEHPAFSYSIVLDLPHVDVRQLGNSLRGLAVDPTGQQAVIPIGNTNSIIVMGAGSEVANLVGILRQVEESARKALEKAPATGPADKPVPPPVVGG